MFNFIFFSLLFLEGLWQAKKAQKLMSVIYLVHSTSSQNSCGLSYMQALLWGIGTRKPKTFLAKKNQPRASHSPKDQYYWFTSDSIGRFCFNCLVGTEAIGRRVRSWSLLAQGLKDNKSLQKPYLLIPKKIL